MTKRKISKIATIIVVVALLTGSGIVYYMFNMPHRDVQSSATDYKITVTELVNEYIANPNAANQKYLKDDGLSAILEIQGTIDKISQNLNGDTTILLTSIESPAGVKCTLIPFVNDRQHSIKEDDQVTVKGVIRAGTYFDEDFQRYEPVVMDQCAIIG